MNEVNHPTHYTSHPSGLEAIQITENLPFNLGNAIKYLWRRDHKGRRDQDTQKALWYLEREKQRRNDHQEDLKRLQEYAREHDDELSRIITRIACIPMGVHHLVENDAIDECIRMIKELK